MGQIIKSLPSVCLSVLLSVCLSVTSLYGRKSHSILMKLYNVNVNVIVVLNANVLRLDEDRRQRRSGISFWT